MSLEIRRPVKTTQIEQFPVALALIDDLAAQIAWRDALAAPVVVDINNGVYELAGEQGAVKVWRVVNLRKSSPLCFAEGMFFTTLPTLRYPITVGVLFRNLS